MKGIKTMHKTNDKDHQLNLIEKITDKAIKQVQKETKNQNRNYQNFYLKKKFYILSINPKKFILKILLKIYRISEIK